MCLRLDFFKNLFRKAIKISKNNKNKTCIIFTQDICASEPKINVFIIHSIKINIFLSMVFSSISQHVSS